jgi:hypothetical protein
MPTIRPALKLVGTDGNAFAVIAACMRAARKAKMPQEDMGKIRDEMMAGDYNHLLATALKHFAVEGEEEEEEEECYECGDLDCEGDCADDDEDEDE